MYQVLTNLHHIKMTKINLYRYVMAEIPQFGYFLNTKSQNCTTCKKTKEVRKYGISYGHSFILLLMCRYHKSKNSPVCSFWGGISFTFGVRLSTVNIPQSLTNTNSTLPYRTYGTYRLNIDEIKGMARNRTVPVHEKTLSVIKIKM